LGANDNKDHWQVKTVFKDFKSGGFNFEVTNGAEKALQKTGKIK
jgi:hypothetical protein